MHGKGETKEELAAFALTMRVAASQEDTFLPNRIDTCGTGGGTVPTFNVSTAVAFVLAAGGLQVTKLGNRAITSQSGSADVLEALGISLELTPEQVFQCLEKVGICFLFAPVFHKATANVQKVRKSLPHKTFFNLLGPLTNPAFPEYQVVGVYAPELTERMAHVFQRLPVKRAMVVHGLSERGKGSLDEVSLLGKTTISEFKDSKIENYSFDPKDCGLPYCKEEDLIGGDAQTNAAILENILSGKEKGPGKDLVALNAAAGLIVAGKADGFKEGIGLAQEIIASGKSYKKVEALREFTNRFVS